MDVTDYEMEQKSPPHYERRKIVFILTVLVNAIVVINVHFFMIVRELLFVHSMFIQSYEMIDTND